MNIYYVSLVRSLMGYYVKFRADSEEIVRRHCSEYFGKLWCSVYDEDYFNNNLSSRFICNVVNNVPIELGSDWEWE